MASKDLMQGVQHLSIESAHRLKNLTSSPGTFSGSSLIIYTELILFTVFSPT